MRLRVTTSHGEPYEWSGPTTTVRAGRAESCGIRFQGATAEVVSWEHLELQRNPDGTAYVIDLRSRNGTYVDGARITAPTLVRVGSTIRLGRAGPALEILELHPLTASASSEPAATLQPAALPVAPMVSRQISRKTTLAAAVVVGMLVALAMGKLVTGPGSPTPPPKISNLQPIQPGPKTSSGENEPAPSPVPKHREEPPKVPDPTTKEDEAKVVNDAAMAGLRLIVVEDPSTHAAWPFAGAVVIGEHTLLTTASVGVELAKFRQRGWHVTLMHDVQQPRIEISDVLVHAAYQQEEPDKQLYFDLALLSTPEQLEHAVALASAADLAELDTGLTLNAIAVDHAGDPINRFEQLQPQVYPGKILFVTSLPPPPGGPRLLHLRGSFPRASCGCPLINAEGHLVAIYSEPAPADKTGPITLQLHYAIVIEPRLIEMALRGEKQDIWVRPQLPAAAIDTKEPSK